MHPEIAKKITTEKKQYLARKAMFGHLAALQDPVLTAKGIAFAAASQNGCSEDELWDWVLAQIK